MISSFKGGGKLILQLQRTTLVVQQLELLLQEVSKCIKLINQEKATEASKSETRQ